MPSIYVSAFQPFASRSGIDTVLALEFAYSPATVADVKAAIRNAAARLGQRNQGGWLPDHRCWYVEQRAFPIVRQRLTAAGYTIELDESVFADCREAAAEAEHQLAATAVRSTIRTWHRRLVLEYHPDRRPGCSDEGMRAINRAHELLLEMLEV